MGKLILCSGARTKRPYVFTSSGIRIYSIEELCYYLYNHVYLIEEGIFTDSLIDWIGTELKLTDRAEKLKLQKLQEADLKTLVTVVLCSADYYTEHEIKGLLKKLDEIIGLPPIKRNLIKANNLLKNNQYTEAVFEYERLLETKEATDLTPEEYGNILHNLAIAKVHIIGLKDASDIFFQAYERNLNEESLRQYLYSIKLGNNPELFEEKAQRYKIDQELLQRISNEIEQMKKEANHSAMMTDINQLKEWKTSGKLNEFYRAADEMIDSWKATIRQI